MRKFFRFIRSFKNIKHIYIELTMALGHNEEFTYFMPRSLETFIAPNTTLYNCLFRANVKRVDVVATTNCVFGSNTEIVYRSCILDDNVTEIISNVHVSELTHGMAVSFPKRLSLINIIACPGRQIQLLESIGGIPVAYKCHGDVIRGGGRIPICSNCGTISSRVTVKCMNKYTTFADFDGVREMEVTIRGPNDSLLLKTLPSSVKKLTIHATVKYKMLWKVVLESIPPSIRHLVFTIPVPVWETVVNCPPTVERLRLKQSGICSGALLKLISSNYKNLMMRELYVCLSNVQRKHMKQLNEKYGRISIN